MNIVCSVAPAECHVCGRPVRIESCMCLATHVHPVTLERCAGSGQRVFDPSLERPARTKRKGELPETYRQACAAIDAAKEAGTPEEVLASATKGEGEG